MENVHIIKNNNYEVAEALVIRCGKRKNANCFICDMSAWSSHKCSTMMMNHFTPFAIKIIPKIRINIGTKHIVTHKITHTPLFYSFFSLSISRRVLSVCIYVLKFHCCTLLSDSFVVQYDEIDSSVINFVHLCFVFF